MQSVEIWSQISRTYAILLLLNTLLFIKPHTLLTSISLEENSFTIIDSYSACFSILDDEGSQYFANLEG